MPGDLTDDVPRRLNTGGDAGMVVPDAMDASPDGVRVVRDRTRT